MSAKKLKIQSGIVPPPRYRERSRYPFADMRDGDSVVVRPSDGLDPRKALNAAIKFATYHGLECRSKSEGDGIRIWLLARTEPKP